MAKDPAGNHLSQQYTWFFTVGGHSRRPGVHPWAPILFLAERRAQDEALQTYFDEDTPLRQSEEGNEVRSLSRR